MHVLGDWHILLLETKICIIFEAYNLEMVEPSPRLHMSNFNKIFVFNKSGWLAYFNNPNEIRRKNYITMYTYYIHERLLQLPSAREPAVVSS